jgi:hypothetical protein
LRIKEQETCLTLQEHDDDDDDDDDDDNIKTEKSRKVVIHIEDILSFLG